MLKKHILNVLYNTKELESMALEKGGFEPAEMAKSGLINGKNSRLATAFSRISSIVDDVETYFKNNTEYIFIPELRMGK